MGKFRTAVSRARAAPDLPIPARLRYITCTKKTSRYPGAPTATATLTVMAIEEDSGGSGLSPNSVSLESLTGQLCLFKRIISDWPCDHAHSLIIKPHFQLPQIPLRYVSVPH